MASFFEREIEIRSEMNERKKSDRLDGGDESPDRNEMRKVLAIMSSESSTCDALPSSLLLLPFFYYVFIFLMTRRW